MYCWSEENNNKLSKNEKRKTYDLLSPLMLFFFSRLQNDSISDGAWTECIKSISYLVIKNHNQNLTTHKLFCYGNSSPVFIILFCCCKTPWGTHSCTLYLLLSSGNEFVVVVLCKKTKHQRSRSVAWISFVRFSIKAPWLKTAVYKHALQYEFICASSRVRRCL